MSDTIVPLDPRMLETRRLNDNLRRTMLGGRVLLTNGILALPQDDQIKVVQRVMQFEAFDPEDGPYGEHDFGAVEIAGEKYYFKIDYYAPDLEHGSSDPADPTVTTRVLTILRADEY